MNSRKQWGWEQGPDYGQGCRQAYLWWFSRQESSSCCWKLSSQWYSAPRVGSLTCLGSPEATCSKGERVTHHRSHAIEKHGGLRHFLKARQTAMGSVEYNCSYCKHQDNFNSVRESPLWSEMSSPNLRQRSEWKLFYPLVQTWSESEQNFYHVQDNGQGYF